MNTYKGYRYPQEIISHAVWLHHRFTSSFRVIEELLACRGIVVTYETIRQWCLKLTSTEMNLHVLAYNLTRMIKIKGVQGLICAMQV